ncbi:MULTISPECIES: FxsA family protein [unclassified Lebetimonas]|uniref:FxsA family protein n=1 Tax=unclassified Lebetimonas TaxID=2648158 RepID=UPI000463DF8C|nr:MULTISPECIES: FxsA family protein [unclassified Lebetimonas]
MGLIYFLIYLFLEILFSYEFMRVFTPLGFFLEILLTAGAGVYILQTLDLSLSTNMHKLMKREITQEEFLSIGLFKLIGAVLLILPGFFSDIIGILFLFEPFARIVAKKLFPRNNFYHKNYKNDDDIIDVEIIEEIPKKD